MDCNIMKLENEIESIINNLVNPRQPCGQAMLLGVKYNEPLLCILNDLLRYCKMHRKASEYPIGQDSYAHEYINDILNGVTGMLSCMGGVALERGIATDSKDNSIMFEIIEYIRMVYQVYAEK